MAIDTAVKRRSSVIVRRVYGLRRSIPAPDGSVDRINIVGQYTGSGASCTAQSPLAVCYASFRDKRIYVEKE